MAKYIYTFLAIFSTCFINYVSLASAQSIIPSPTPGFTYPVTIIDGVTCNSQVECRQLCDDPVYRAACKALKPATSETETKPSTTELFSRSEFVQDTQASLGCDSPETCKQVCSQPEKYEACHQIALKYQLRGGYDSKIQKITKDITQLGEDVSDEEKQQIQQLQEKVVAIAGVPPQELKSFCSLVENQDKCDQIAKELNLKGGKKIQGPGGCQSPQSCKTYCEVPENINECQNFDIPGLNGCKDATSCQQQLQQNPEAATRVNKLQEFKRIENPTDPTNLTPGSTLPNQRSGEQILPNTGVLLTQPPVRRGEQPNSPQPINQPGSTNVAPLPNTQLNPDRVTTTPIKVPTVSTSNIYETRTTNTIQIQPTPTPVKTETNTTYNTVNPVVNTNQTRVTETVKSDTTDTSTQIRGVTVRKNFWQRMLEGLF